MNLVTKITYSLLQTKKTVELIRRLNVVEEIRNYPAEIRPGFRTNNRCFIENYKLNSKQTIDAFYKI